MMFKQVHYTMIIDFQCWYSRYFLTQLSMRGSFWTSYAQRITSLLLSRSRSVIQMEFQSMHLLEFSLYQMSPESMQEHTAVSLWALSLTVLWLKHQEWLFSVSCPFNVMLCGMQYIITLQWVYKELAYMCRPSCSLYRPLQAQLLCITIAYSTMVCIMVHSWYHYI